MHTSWLGEANESKEKPRTERRLRCKGGSVQVKEGLKTRERWVFIEKGKPASARALTTNKSADHYKVKPWKHGLMM